MLDRKWLQRWVAAVNTAVIFLLWLASYIGHRQEAQLRTLLYAPPIPTHQLIKNYFPLLCIAILLLTGIAVEVRRWKWAWIINAAFYWLVFIPSLWRSVTY